MNVYIYHSDQWHLAGELQQTQKANRHDFSYGFEYAKNYVNNENTFALNSMFPVRLMEVFKASKVDEWLAQFYPLEATTLNPNYCLGNVIVTPTLLDDVELNQSDSILIEHFLERTTSIGIGDRGYSNLAFHNGQPYWFVAADELSIFPTREIENNPALVPLMLPASTQSRFGHSVRSDFNRVDLSYYIDVLVWINNTFYSKNNQLLNTHSAPPESLTKFALPRHDIIKNEHGHQYIGVEKIHSLFYQAYQNSDDLLGFFIALVSAYQHSVDCFDSFDLFIAEIIKRDIVLRLFKSPYSIADIDVIKSEPGYTLAPFAMELFASSSSQNRSLKKVLNWPYPICVDHQIDYPLLCETLGQIIDSHTLLLRLSEFSEQLTTLKALPPPNHSFDSNIGKVVDKIASFDQQLARWGLLI